MMIRGDKFIFFSSLAERIFFFLIFLFIARKYTPEIYGQIITIFSLANIFIIILDLGLPVFLQREISLNKKNASELFSNILTINLLIFPVYLISIFIYCKIAFKDIDSGLLMGTAVLVYIYFLGNILNKALSGSGQFKNQFKALIISRSINLFIILISIYFFNLNIFTLILLLLPGALLQVSMLLHYTVKKLPFSFKLFRIEKARPILTVSIPLGLAVMFNFLYDKIDIVLISKLTDYNVTAYYNIAYGIFKTSTIVFSFLFVSGLTKVSYLSKNKKAVRLFFRKYAFILTWISLILTVVLFFGAGVIINVIYTDKFGDAISILKILSFAVLGLALNNLSGIILTSLGFFRMNMIITLIGLIINVILNLIFIPKYGASAAAFVTIVTEYFILIADVICIRKFLTS